MAPSTSPGTLIPKTMSFLSPTTGGSMPHPTSISYCPTETVVWAYAAEKPAPPISMARISRPFTDKDLSSRSF